MKGIQLWPPITSPCTHILPTTAVQLVSLFQVVFIALVQAALLRHKLPWALWPAAALMIGGAASEWQPCMSCCPLPARHASSCRLRAFVACGRALPF